MHVHVQSNRGEAKFWLEPAIELAANYSLTEKELGAARRLVEERNGEIRSAWKKHFGN